MNDGNASYLNGLINFDKLRMMGARVMDLQQLTQTSYPFTKNPVCQNYLHKPLVELSFEKLKTISKDLEPPP